MTIVTSPSNLQGSTHRSPVFPLSIFRGHTKFPQALSQPDSENMLPQHLLPILAPFHDSALRTNI
jgi:hypothetical protein